MTDQELNILVAETVMGWHQVDDFTADDNEFLVQPEDDYVIVSDRTHHCFAWSPAEEISDAWEIAEREGITIERDGLRGNWGVCVWNAEHIHWYRAEDESVTRAICFAALKAKGVDVG